VKDRKGAEGGYRDVSCFIKVPTLGEPYPSGPGPPRWMLGAREVMNSVTSTLLLLVLNSVTSTLLPLHTHTHTHTHLHTHTLLPAVGLRESEQKGREGEHSS
jgi:hypothetical protein